MVLIRSNATSEISIRKYTPVNALGYLLWFLIAVFCIPIALFSLPMLFRLLFNTFFH